MMAHTFGHSLFKGILHAEKLKSCILSHLRTPAQSLGQSGDACWTVGFAKLLKLSDTMNDDPTRDLI